MVYELDVHRIALDTTKPPVYYYRLFYCCIDVAFCMSQMLAETC